MYVCIRMYIYTFVYIYTRCESQVRDSPMGPNGGLLPCGFLKRISLGFHIFIKKCPMVAAKRGAGTTHDSWHSVYSRAQVPWQVHMNTTALHRRTIHVYIYTYIYIYIEFTST